MPKPIVISIEDYHGNTLMAFEINDQLDIGKTHQCEMADVDYDHHFGTANSMVRIQSTVREG